MLRGEGKKLKHEKSDFEGFEAEGERERERARARERERERESLRRRRERKIEIRREISLVKKLLL